MEAEANGPLVLELICTGNPTPSITWTKDRKPVADSESTVLSSQAIEGTNQTSYKLTVASSKSEDGGAYVAKVKNFLGEASAQTKVDILYKPVFVKELVTELNVKENDTFKFQSEVDAYPKAEITWYKKVDSEETKIVNDAKFKAEELKNNANLTIKGALLKDTAVYIVKAKNKIGEVQSESKFNVCVPPKFLKAADASTEVEIGKDFTVSGVVRGLPLPEIKFLDTATGQALAATEDGSVDIKTTSTSETEVEFTLLIKSITESTSMNYECIATNTVGECKSKVDIKMTKPPQFVTKPEEVISLTLGKDVLLTCTVSSAPNATVSWFKDGKKLSASKRILITEIKEPVVTPNQKSYSLKIVSATKEDSGSYSVTAVNKLGDATAPSDLTIEYAPIITKDLKPKEKTSEDSSFKYEISVKGCPKPKITWFYEETELSSSEYTMTNENEVYSLTINKISASSAGKYSAIATNDIGTAKSVVSELDVDLKPTITPMFEATEKTQTQLIEVEDNSISLEFTIVGKPDPTVNLSKDDVVFKASEKRITLTNQENNIYKLSIPDVKSADGGLYKINAKNSAAVTSFIIDLKIRAAPKLVKQLKAKMEAIENNKVELICSVAPGVYPLPELKWYRNDELLDEKNTADFVILNNEKTNTLVIEKASLPLNASKFKFVCSNELGSCETETTLEVFSVPVFTKNITDAEPFLMQQFEWNFELDASPEPKLKVIRNDKEINLAKEDRIKLTAISDIKDERRITSYNLKFEQTAAEDLGFYKIEASNKAGSAVTTAQLTVKGGPCFIKKPQDASFLVGKPLKVDFEISGIPEPEITWLKDGEAFTFTDRIKCDNKGKAIYWITFKTCTKEDLGSYTIKLANENGKAEETFNLSVQTAPELTKPLDQTMELVEGTRCEFKVIIKGNPKPNIVWNKTKSSLNADIEKSRIKLVENVEECTYSLVIEKCLATDSGSFIVKGKNPLGEVTSTCALTVQTFPRFNKELTSGGKDVTKTQVEMADDIVTKILANEKSNLKLECQVTGLPKPTAKWFYGNEEIKNSDKYKLESKQDSYFLNIKSLSVGEKGMYRVDAENSVGTTVSKIIVDLNTIPVFVKEIENVEVVLENDTQKVEFVCVFNSKPKADVTWWYQNKEIKDGGSNAGSDYFISEESTADAEETETTTATLKIQNISTVDAGSFKCKVKNCAGEANTAAVLSVLKAPVILQQLPAAINLNEKEEIKLEGRVSDAVPKAVVSWFKDDVELKTSKRLIIAKPVIETATSSAMYTLTIPESLPTDVGRYTLRAVNKLTTVETNCSIDILSAPKITKDLKAKMECISGDKVSLDVTATGNPEPEFKWLVFNHEKNTEEEVAQQDGVEVRFLASSKLYQLIFSGIKREAIGKYTLKLKNIAGEAETSIDINVNYPPTIIKDIEGISVTEGSECQFLAVVDGNPKPTIEWHKNDAKLKADKRMVNKVEENQYSLLINETKNADKGTFKAVLKNKVGTVETTPVELGITFGPAILKSLKDAETVEGKPLEMVCDVSGTPKPEFKWFKGDVELTESEKYSFGVKSETYTLTVSNSEEKDSGLYKAVFKNEFGSSETKANANVLIAPRFERPLKEEHIGNLTTAAELIAVLKCRPDAKLKFVKENRELLIKDRLKVTTNKLSENETEIILTISDLQASDAALYKIEATNKVGSATTQCQLIVKGGPVFTRIPKEVSVAEKKNVKFDCECIGLPQPVIEWYKDGVLIEKADNINIEARKALSTLSIKDINRTHDGRYVMKAKNESGEAEASVILNVDIAPYIITPLAEKIEVRENQSTQLACEIGGAPVPAITWSKKGEDLVCSKENRLEMITDGQNNILMLDCASMKDAGIYNIAAVNRVGKTNCKTELIVLIEPRFVRKIIDTQVIEKKITKLEAEIVGVPKPQVIWYKNGVEISKEDDRIQTHDAKGGVFQLIIKNSQQDDTGTYICKAVNDVGQVECKAQLEIEMKPEFIKKLETLHAVESCEAEWQFQVTGLPKPDISFARNNVEIDFTECQDYSIETLEDNNYVLKFKNVVHKDIGSWTCIATNSAGKASCVSKLETLPLAPPKFIKELTNSRLAQNVDNRIEVVVSGVPFPQIEWFKNDVIIDMTAQGEKFSTERDIRSGTHTLIMKNSQIELDSGLYKARIYNPGGECFSEGYYTVKGFAPFFVERPEKIYAIKDQTAVFAAVVEGDPLPEVTWAKGRNDIVESDTTKIYYDETCDVNFMEVLNCSQKDAGTYQVTATNQFGSDTAPVTLMFTHNPDDVVDYKLNLKNRTPKRSLIDESDPDWGKLKKAGSKRGSADENPDGFKLKHWEKEKEPSPEHLKIKKEEVKYHFLATS